MPQPVRPFTAEELERRPDLERYELWDGQLVPMTPVGHLHGRVVLRLGSLLERHVRERNLGDVVAEVGVKLKSQPDTVFAPDLAFMRRERIPDEVPRGFWRGASDLAIEVLSPEDRHGKMRRKVDEYLARRTPMVVVVDPDRRTVTIHRGGAATVILRSEDTLDLGEIVPGFTCPVARIFERSSGVSRLKPASLHAPA